MNLASRVPIGVSVVTAALLLHQLPALPVWSGSAFPSILAVIALVLALVLRSPTCRLLLWSCVFIAIQLIRFEHALEGLAPDSINDLSVRAQVQVMGLPVRDDQGWRFKARVLRVESQARAHEIVGRDLQVHWSAGYTASTASLLPIDIAPGQHWHMELRLRPWRALRNPVFSGPVDVRVRAMEEGLWARAQVRTQVHPILLAQAKEISCSGFECWVLRMDQARYQVRQALVHKLEQDHARVSAMLVALVLGDQSMISSQDWGSFNRTGIGHLISISGLHVTMIAAAGAWLSSRAWRGLVVRSQRCARWAERYCGHLLAGRLGAVAVGALYCLFAGAQVPAQRTFWMLLALALITLLRRRCDALLSLSCAAVIVLVIDPWAVASPGFWLSFVATWALMRGLRTGTLATQKKPHRALRAWQLFKAATQAQCVVTLGLVPLSACLFGYFSLLSPFANAWAIPLISYFVTPLALTGAIFWVLAQFVWSPLAVLANALVESLWTLAALSLELMMRALALMESQEVVPSLVPLAGPGHLLGLVCVAAAFIGMVLLVLSASWPSRLVALILMLFVFVPHHSWPIAWRENRPAGIEITSFDLGAGSATLLRTPDRTILYDTGAGGLGTALTASPIGQDQAARVLLPFLRERGIHSLDLLVISHADREHQGGLASILSTIAVKSLLLPHHAGCDGAHLSTPQTSVHLFKMENPKHANDSSCVMRVAVQSPEEGELSVLLLGDLTPSGQKSLLAAWPTDLLRSSVVQMPGQGARQTWFPSFLQAVTPRFALIQVAQAHWRGYPKAEALDPLVKQNTHILRTDLDGAISLKLTAGKPARIWREKHNSPRYFESRPIRATR